MTARRIAIALTCLLVCGSAVAAARAADVPLAGRRIHLRDERDAVERKSLVKLADRAVDLTGIDPMATGARAEIGTVGGGSLVLELPASGWSRRKGMRPSEFRYRSKTGPVRSARLLQGRFVRLWARGPGAYALGGVPQHEVGVVLSVGDVRFCGAFGGRIQRDDGTRFIARQAPAPAACPDFAGPVATPTTGPRATGTPVDATPTAEATPTGVASETPSLTATPEPSATATPEPSPSIALDPTATTTATLEPSATSTATPTEPEATRTPLPSPTATACDGPTCPGCADADGDGAGVGLDCAVADCDDADPEVRPGKPERCNTRDDDCDTIVDEGFDLATDEQNCGACGAVCSLPNASEVCVGGTCGVGTCDAGWSNADGDGSNGCECSSTDPVPTSNDSAETAAYLGRLAETGSSASVQTRIMPWSTAEGFDVDWYRFDAADDFLGDFSVLATLTGLPTGTNYRLRVYRGVPPGDGDIYACGFLCLGSCRYPASKQATSNGNATVTITMDEGSICSDDGGTFYVSIEQLSGPPFCGNFTLTVRNG